MPKKLKVEFLLPLKYNDGTAVEPEKLYEVREKIVSLFGAVTIHPLSTEGIWIDPLTQQKYYDSCRRFEVAIDQSPDTEKLLKTLKEDLKNIFKQEEIFMYYSEITLI